MNSILVAKSKPILLDLENYSMDFAELFLRRTTMSFLQSHANPSNCRYPKFGVT